jgi:hypothetical protein
MSLELDTDAATVRRLVSLVGGTVGCLTAMGIAGVMYASGAFSSMLGGKVEHLTAEEKFARTLEHHCRFGMALGGAMATTGRTKSNPCDGIGRGVLEAMDAHRSISRDIRNRDSGPRKQIGSGLIPD